MCAYEENIEVAANRWKPGMVVQFIDSREIYTLLEDEHFFSHSAGRRLDFVHWTGRELGYYKSFKVLA